MANPLSTTIPTPTRRPLRAYAFDPSRGKILGNQMSLEVGYRPLARGPIDLSRARDEVAVLDYDFSRNVYYEPVDLDDPFILIPNGLTPSEGDPRFHQQMVYAVVRDTIEHFETALGRRIHWRRAERTPEDPRGWKPEDILTLTLFPHAMQEANAYYSPDAHGILFGYFQASRDDPGRNLPGQPIFTCLSHDIIVHETTHAIIDGLRSYFMEQTNPDVPAFHEAFADLAALFRHFGHREVLRDAIERTGGRLYTPALKEDPLADLAQRSWLTAGEQERNPLIELAGQFGEATGLRKGLRSAIGKPKTMQELQVTTECHERGSVLVAAVFDAFFSVYIQRSANYFRIFRAAGGQNRDDIPAPLSDALCREATRTADQFFETCVRALDYLPPVDVTFGDFLRAVITSETDYDPADEEGIRNAWMQAFRRRGIIPDDAPFFSEESLCWPTPPQEIEIRGLPFGGPLGLTWDDRRKTAAILYAFVRKHRDLLGLESGSFRISSFHPLNRVDAAGGIRWDLVVEVVQTRETGPFPLRGGTTLVVSTHGTTSGDTRDKVFLRYVIAKPLGGSTGAARADRHHAYMTDLGFKPRQNVDVTTYLKDTRINFALVHGDQ